jgi:septum formation protein
MRTSPVAKDWARRAAIQGRAEAFVRTLAGSHSGVIGLPLYDTRALLETAGVPLG